MRGGRQSPRSQYLERVMRRISKTSSRLLSCEDFPSTVQYTPAAIPFDPASAFSRRVCRLLPSRRIPHSQDRWQTSGGIRPTTPAVCASRLPTCRRVDRGAARQPEKVRGCLGAVEPDWFKPKPQDRSASERRIAFAAVKSVKAVQGPRGKVGVWIVAGVLVTVIAVALAVYLQHRHNEGL